MFLHNIKGFGDTISSVHNGILELLLGLGLVGFFIWIIAISLTVRLAVNSFIRKENLFVAIGYLSVGAVTLMSLGVGGWLTPMMSYFLVATGYLVAHQRQSKTVHKNPESSNIILNRYSQEMAR